MADTNLVFVHGPRACGKSTNAMHLARVFGATACFDDWCPYRDQRKLRRAMKQGLVLALTVVAPDAIRAAYPDAKIIAFSDVDL